MNFFMMELEKGDLLTQVIAY